MSKRNSMNQTSCDILIIGGGIIGLSLARELVHRGAEGIVVLEKEAQLGQHASGRNSGVLHSGIYYTEHTLMARFCAEGNAKMKTFCRENKLTLNENGKVIVTRTPEEIPVLQELKQRADKNQVPCEVIDEEMLRDIEPYAQTIDTALYSPNTAVIQPKEILSAIAEEIIASGSVDLQLDNHFMELEGDHVARTSKGSIRFTSFINAAGMYADRIAHQFEICKQYRILPFKGTYKRLRSQKSHLVHGNIYPVPDLRNPFLGVHLTRGADGIIYIGPTAIPALGREHYGILRGIDLEALAILMRDAILFFADPGFRNVALSEPAKWLNSVVLSEARKLVPNLRDSDIQDAAKVGLRAQLVNTSEKCLVTDFLIVKEGPSLHILNAISPAFTSSMAFAEYAVSEFMDENGKTFYP